MTSPTHLHWQASSEKEMLRVGRELTAYLHAGDVVLLVGEMGAGKTTLAKAIVAAFGAGEPEDVSSPTFTLVHEYLAGSFVFHLDLYRLESEQQARAIGIDEMLDRLSLGSGALMLVEWGERFPNLWPESAVLVQILNLDGIRHIRVETREPPATS